MDSEESEERRQEKAIRRLPTGMLIANSIIPRASRGTRREDTTHGQYPGAESRAVQESRTGPRGKVSRALRVR